MIVKKKFKILENDLEEAFLNEQSENGFLLKDYDGKTYTFEPSTTRVYYMVEYFFNELSQYEINQYKKRGYKLQFTYVSSVKGFYYFFISKNEVNDLHRNLLDKYQQLLNSKHRTDKFSLTVFFSTFLLFSYLYFKSYDPIYIIILLLIVLLSGYYGNLYLKMVKKLSEYTKILTLKESESNGNNERRSKES